MYNPINSYYIIHNIFGLVKLMAAPDIEYKTNKELWSLYKLDDGTTLKLKIILVRVIWERAPEGMKGLGFALNNVVAILPNKLPSGKKIPAKQDIKIKETIIKVRNEYTLTSGENAGTKIFIEPNIATISRTDKADARGEPIYNVQIAPAISIKPKKANTV